MKKSLLSCFLLLALTACKEDNGPTPEPDNLSLIGWATGNTEESNGLIAKTEDGGKSWVYQTKETDFPKKDVSGILALNDQVCWTLVIDMQAGRGHLYKTEDGGKNWLQQAKETEFIGQKFGIASIDGVNIWIAGFGWLYSSHDSGRSWKKQEMEHNFTPFECEHIATYDGINIYIGGGIKETEDQYAMGVYYSNDAGKTWDTHRIGLLNSLIDISTPSSESIYLVGNSGFAAKTTDNFRSLTIFNNAHISQNSDNNGVYAIDDQRVWIAIDYGAILFTSDGGKNWTEGNVPADLKGDAIMRISFLQDGMRGAAVSTPLHQGKSGTIIYTSDGGKNWDRATGGIKGDIAEISFVQSKRR